jgi:hypothetical protein
MLQAEAWLPNGFTCLSSKQKLSRFLLGSNYNSGMHLKCEQVCYCPIKELGCGLELSGSGKDSVFCNRPGQDSVQCHVVTFLRMAARAMQSSGFRVHVQCSSC